VRLLQDAYICALQQLLPFTYNSLSVKGDGMMSIYVGISNKTGELVAGEMFVEVEITKDRTREQITIFDYEDADLHPVDACIKLPLY